MSTVTETEAAIEQLAPEAQREPVDWLNSRLIGETPAMLAAIDEADRSLAAEGVLCRRVIGPDGQSCSL